MAKKNKRGNTATVDTPKSKTEVEVVRPNVLAKELGIDGKRVRAFLRNKFPRQEESRNTNWVLTKEQVDAVREKFTKKEDDKAAAASS